MVGKEVLVSNIDVELLRKQRDSILLLLEEIKPVSGNFKSGAVVAFILGDQEDYLDGILNLLDAMLDSLESGGEVAVERDYYVVGKED